ncbi:unnamed protein product [Effrenium voratum]|uniref:Uncharacterized protein n=1 Tax=Effrenium voratum TaxID=2562239 RepID=A0AA36HJB0_9DINO|nr:unnamed protein product [Effrenium voratum]
MEPLAPENIRGPWSLAPGRGDPPRRMQQSLEKRRKDQVEQFARALAEVSPEEFMAPGAGPRSLDLRLSGAIPPLSFVRRDVLGTAAIALSEKRAAEELIAKSRQESLNANHAIVQEARRMRALKSQTQRPFSMQSTRDASGLHSRLSGDVDLADLTPEERAMSAETYATRSPSPIPVGRAFEDMLAQYYRSAEEIADKEFAEAQKARFEETDRLQKEHVHREHFEMRHRRREAAIVHELFRRERRRVFDSSRAVLVTDRLEDERRKWRIEQQRRNEAAKQQRTQTRERREKFESHTDFILSRGALDRACGKADRRQHRQQQLQKTKAQVDQRKEKWSRHAGQQRARRLFNQEQKRICDQEKERQHLYCAAKQRQEREQELEEKQLHVQMHHACASLLKEMKTQTTWSSTESASIQDLSKYHNALEAIATLSDEVWAALPEACREGLASTPA